MVAISTLPDCGVCSALKEVQSEDGPIEVLFFWVMILTETHEFHHFKRFDSEADAKALSARVTDTLANGTSPENLSEDFWAVSEVKTFEERMREEMMWEVKEAIMEGATIPLETLFAAGLV